MSGIWVLTIIFLISSLPVIIVYVWFRLAKFQFSLIRFLLVLLAGAAAFFPALLLQELLSFSFQNSRAALFFHHFIRIALTEEASRFFILLLFFWISGKISSGKSSEHGSLETSGSEEPQSLKPLNNQISFNVIKKATLSGLVAGLGFALLENAVYAASDINVALLRIITAAVHGACGSRIGAAAMMIRRQPFQAILRIITAVTIHGIYNLMLTMPGFSAIAAILIAVSALFTSIVSISRWSDDTHNPPAEPAVTDTSQKSRTTTLDKDKDNS
ncbi:MAG: PrsW family glutamic-type intramembrane protease [Treponema sp.]|nr:PrsW family glutamic-type intramembrane protease [Treponema sp.]MCL2250522.1 PrsW family glutamic-type intramembrane protease [Treponema sp.]